MSPSSRQAALLAIALCAACGPAAAPPRSAAPAPPIITLADSDEDDPAAEAASQAAAKPPPGRAEAPPGYVELRVGGVIAAPGGHAVVLVDDERQLAVPIFISGTEALSIKLRHNKRRFARPLTHDLLDDIMDKLGGEVVKIHIDGIRDNTFIGAVFVRRGDEIFEVDARPSDAIALALGQRAPIFVHNKVLQIAGIKRDELLPDTAPPPSINPQPI